MSTQKENLLPVEVEKGMFSNEYAVKINIQGHLVGTLFVHDSLIRRHANKSYLRIHSIFSSKTKNNKDVLLPTEIMETGTRWISIPVGELVQDDFK